MKKHFSISTIILSFLLLVSVLLSVSFGIEKNNIMDRLNEALATISQQPNIQMNETPPGVEQELPEDVEAFKVYVVQEGDYLESIKQLNFMMEEHGQIRILNIGLKQKKTDTK